MPKASSRVCSEHFISGKPTVDNPDPVLKLGYDCRKPHKRKNPATRLESVTAPKKGKRNPGSEGILEVTHQI